MLKLCVITVIMENNENNSNKICECEGNENYIHNCYTNASYLCEYCCEGECSNCGELVCKKCDSIYDECPSCIKKDKSESR